MSVAAAWRQLLQAIARSLRAALDRFLAGPTPSPPLPSPPPAVAPAKRSRPRRRMVTGMSEALDAVAAELHDPEEVMHSDRISGNGETPAPVSSVRPEPEPSLGDILAAMLADAGPLSLDELRDWAGEVNPELTWEHVANAIGAEPERFTSLGAGRYALADAPTHARARTEPGNASDPPKKRRD